MTLRRPVVGDTVTIITHKTGQLTRALVQESNAHVSNQLWITPDMLLEAERGVAWALGVEGPEVDALRVAGALL